MAVGGKWGREGGTVGIEAQSLFCPQCNQAQPVKGKLLLALPTGEKIGYYCAVCGAELGSKMQPPPGR